MIHEAYIDEHGYLHSGGRVYCPTPTGGWVLRDDTIPSADEVAFLKELGGRPLPEAAVTDALFLFSVYTVYHGNEKRAAHVALADVEMKYPSTPPGWTPPPPPRASVPTRPMAAIERY